MVDQSGIFTNNRWRLGSGAKFNSVNPAKEEEILWEGRAANANEVNETVENAKQAFPEWSNLTLNERSTYLHRFADILTAKHSYLSEIISKETGKVLWDSKNEVQSMIGKIAISLEAYGSRCAGIMHTQDAIRSVTRHLPHGVVAVLGPFNFPGHLPNGHIIPALLAGNTVIFKPSELTPLVAQETMKCWQEAKLPDGVINLVQGGSETGQALVQNQNINGIYFTGSYKTGMKLVEYHHCKISRILALEMGGNNPLIIGTSVDPIIAAYHTIQSAYLSSGQRCTCARRLIVPKGEKGDAFIETLILMISHIIVGPYNAIPEPYMGPIIRESHALQILEAQRNLADQGGKILVEMKHLEKGTGFLSPGLMDVTNIKDRSDEEIFGPFLQVIRVDNLQAAIQEANNTKYGLAAGILSNDQEEYNFFYKNIKAGIINWNTQLTGASSTMPFGGIKCSGNYRPSAYYAADYCSYPVSSLETSTLKIPATIAPGLKIYLD